MGCPSCGFEIDEANESQLVCPRCGADPAEHLESALDPELLLAGVPAEEIEQMLRPRPIIAPGNDLVN